MKTLTVFTPTYNRAHTISRTYKSLCRQTCDDFEWLIIDDGSSDDTRRWVESLGQKTVCKGQKFDWMGRSIEGEDENHFVIQLSKFRLTYIYKPNGGLYTGYNVAYNVINTELCVCIDSDDYAPDDLVEKVAMRWFNRDTSKDYCGIVGLDFNVVNKEPIGGAFTKGIIEGYYTDVKRGGDTKEVMRVDLMKMVAPMIGFEGEKDFNPFYMISQIVDKYPILVENSNLCWVEYQIGADSMSQAIFKQFKRSPKSYAQYRINELNLKRNRTWKRNFITCGHYISSCIFSRDLSFLEKSPKKLMTLMAIPIGIALNIYIRYKAK